MYRRIVGGSSEIGTRGTTVKLRIDPLMLTQSQNVTSLWISNCDIGEQLSTGGILSAMPSGLIDLNLKNTLMRSEPKDLSALQSLLQLQMEQNYLSTLSAQVALSKLKKLDLAENELASFEPFVPSLETLNLNKNKLTAIPTAIYSMSNLQEALLSENPIVAVVLSASQYAFLSHLRITIDPPPTPPPQPVVYVARSVRRLLSSNLTSEILASKDVNFTHAVAVPVGTSEKLAGMPVWILPDSVHDVFLAQQQVISKSDVVNDGTPLRTYDAVATELAAKALTPTPSSPSAVQSVTDSSNPSTNPPSTSVQSGHGSGNSRTIISVVAVAAVALLAGVLLFAYHRRRGGTRSDMVVQTPDETLALGPYKASATSRAQTPRLVGSNETSAATTPHTGVRDLLSSRRIRLSDLEDVRPIATSAMGVVWLVRLRGSRLLASKRLVRATTERMTQFMNEIIVAAALDHPSIVQFVGIAWSTQSDMQALFEYLPGGDLETHLHSVDRFVLEWETQKLLFAIGILEALVCTHSFNPPLLHRDVRTKNVLLDENNHPKLGNFGGSRFASEQNTMTTEGVGSGRWLAPEILQGSTDYDAASDMYAFGVLLSELDSHQTPYIGARDAKGNAMVETAILERVARGELRPTFSAECPRVIAELASLCLAQDPAARPAAIPAVYRLRQLKRAWDEQGIFLSAESDIAIL